MSIDDYDDQGRAGVPCVPVMAQNRIEPGHPFPEFYSYGLYRREQAEDREFFVLWDPSSTLPPKVMFGTPDQAGMIADLMVRKRGKPVYVLGSVSRHEREPIPVKVTQVRR